MAVSSNIPLLSSAIISNTTTLSSAKALMPGSTELIITSLVSARTDGTYTTSVEHSPDGTNWFVLDSCAAQSANGMVIKQVTVPSFHMIRASVLSSSVTAGATVEVNLWFCELGV